MKQPPQNFLGFAILTAAIVAACLAMLAPTSRAQPASKSGAEKIGAAAQPASAAKTGDKAAAKPKAAEAPKEETPPAAKEIAKPKPEVVLPPLVKDLEKPLPKVAPVKIDPVVVAPQTAGARPLSSRKQGLMAGITIFVLAIFVGFELINKVPTTLHTPLMSGSNAISGITVVGALIAAGQGFHFSSFLGFFAVALAMINVVGGFLVTHRMLLMFKRK